MNTCYPALITAALFVAIVILDVIQTKYINGAELFFFGSVAVGLMAYLCLHDAEFVAWGLFLIPLVLLIVGVSIPKPGPEPPLPAPAPMPVVKQQPTCSICGGMPCSCLSGPSPVVHLPATPVKDVSGSVAPPAVTALPVQTPPTTTTCGGPGRTQCIDTTVLPSA